MHVLEYEPDNIVSIYTDWQNDVGYEGEAVLIEKKEVGDSFYMDYEKLYVPLNRRTNLTNREIDKIQVQLNSIYEYLEYYCNLGDRTINNFISECIPYCNNDNGSYNELFVVIESWKKTYENNPHLISNIFKVQTQYITRYFQQKYTKNWSQTLFREEKWIIEFRPQSSLSSKKSLYYNTFRTVRKLRILHCISPLDLAKKKEVLTHTTYNKKCFMDSVRYGYKYEYDDNEDFDDENEYYEEDNYYYDSVSDKVVKI